MKQEELAIQRMSAPPTTISPDYLELRLALFAGERDLEQRRKSVPKSSLQPRDNQGAPAVQQRTHSCKYPSGSRRVIQPRSRHNSPGDHISSERGQSRGGGGGSGVTDEKEGSSSSPRSLSAPQSRSSSWKKMRRPKDVRHFREVYGTGSGPDGERGTLEETIISKLHELKLLQDEDCCVVRSFSTSPRGIINRGDSFKRKSEALGGIAPGGSAPGGMTPQKNSSSDVLLLPLHQTTHNSRSQSWSTRESSSDGGKDEVDGVEGKTVPHLHSCSETGIPSYTVLVMGDHGVGKTALLQQFMTSEFMAAIETSFDMECEKTVSVLLDGQETILNFVDLPISVQKECVQYSEIEAYLITYSITERESFDYAANILQELRRQGRSDAAVILVANKNDLVRSRQVTEEEGKSLCDRMNCKYIEVSAALNHRVDELLAGLVHQIRLNPRRLGTRTESNQSDSHNKQSGCLNAALAFVVELIRKRKSTSRSCENLWVL